MAIFAFLSLSGYKISFWPAEQDLFVLIAESTIPYKNIQKAIFKERKHTGKIIKQQLWLF
jgi:hypothetical protein